MKPQFGVVDYAVFLLALCLSLSIGVFHAFRGRNQKDNKAYLTGRGTLTLVPVAISIVVSFISGHGLLGTPAEVYDFGSEYFLHILAVIIGNTLGIFLHVPLFYPLRITSAFEYLEMRFKSRTCRIVGNIAKLFAQLFLNGVGICAPAVALGAVTGIPVYAAICICAITATIYTCIGGIQAVIWTDVLQSFFIFVGLTAVTIMGTIKVGGLQRVWDVNKEWGRLEFFDFNPDPTERTSFWTIVIGMSTLYFCLTGIQATVQRFCALPTFRQAQMSLVINMMGVSLAGVLACLTGVVAFAYYATIGCDPVQAKTLRQSNQILPYFVVDVLSYPGVPGVFVACITGAALSTSSSSLNAMAAMTWQDLLSQRFRHVSEKTKTSISKGLVVIIGVIALGIAFIISNIKGTFIQIMFSLTGSMLGPVTGMFFLGASNPRASAKSALIAICCGWILTFTISTGSTLLKTQSAHLPSPTDNCHEVYNVNISAASLYPYDTANNSILISTQPQAKVLDNMDGFKKIFQISYMYLPAIGLFTVVIVGSLLSLIPALKFEYEVPDEHLFPFARYIRRKMGSCGTQMMEVNLESPNSGAAKEKFLHDDNNNTNNNDNNEMSNNENCDAQCFLPELNSAPVSRV